MTERITKATLFERAANLNRRLRSAGTPLDVRGHYVLVEHRNGHVALDEYNDGACIRTLAVGTKREIADFLHAMIVGIDMHAHTPEGSTTTMSDEQVYEAIAQMRTQCELKMTNYESVSARAVLYELGYHGEQCEQVLQHIYDGGFTYCLDPQFSATHYDPNNPRSVNGMITDRPSADACYWGPDQLRSRLDSLFNTPRTRVRS